MPLPPIPITNNVRPDMSSHSVITTLGPFSLLTLHPVTRRHFILDKIFGANAQFGADFKIFVYQMFIISDGYSQAILLRII